jgi:hypothetical protein
MPLEDQLSRATDDLLARLERPHDRMFSWDHCYNFFCELPARPSKLHMEHMALHLAFYLASYGMYRGSTALLGHDYTVLIPVVEELLRVRNGKPATLVANAASEDQAFRAWEQHEHLQQFLKKSGIEQKNLSILSTKILLGTLVTTPAFDNSFKKAIKELGIGAGTCSHKNFLKVFVFVREHGGLFQRQVNRFHHAGFKHYPAMRVVDGLLWHLGGGDT